MSFRDWLHHVAIGGCLTAGVLFGAGALAQQQDRVGGQSAGQTTKNENATETGTAEPATTYFAPGYRVDRSNYRAICDSPKDAESADICMQWRQAEASETQALYTMFGFYALLGTLVFTGIAAAAAYSTVTTMQNTAERQLRAYMCVSTSHLRDLAVGKDVQAHIIAKNSGQTPAHDVSAWIAMALGPFPAPLPFQSPDQPMPRARAVTGPGTSLHLTVHLGRELTKADGDGLDAGNLAFYVLGEITYLDAFGHPRFTRFRSQYGGSLRMNPNGALSHMEDGNEAN